MAKRRKLTDKLRQEIKDNYKKLPKKGFTGEALVYLNRVKGAAKARKLKKDNTLNISGVKIKKNTQLYKTVAASASLKGITVRHYVQAYPDEIEDFRKSGRIVLQRETEYVITDINTLPKKAKVFQNGKQKTREEVIYNLNEFKNYAQRVSNIPAILYDEASDYDSNMYLEFPEPSEYLSLHDKHDYEMEHDEDEGEDEFWARMFEELLDDEYPDIIYFKS